MGKSFKDSYDSDRPQRLSYEDESETPSWTKTRKVKTSKNVRDRNKKTERNEYGDLE